MSTIKQLGDKLRSCITGSELLELARKLSIEVHPRTAAIIKRKIAKIDRGTMSFNGSMTSFSTTGVWDIYNEVSETLTDWEDAGAVDEVFGEWISTRRDLDDAV